MAMPGAIVRSRTPIEYSILHDAKAAGPAIGIYAGCSFSDIVIDRYGRLFDYTGVALRRMNGEFDVDALRPGEFIVQPGLIYRHRKQRKGR
jgi:hypothetical protein